MGKGAAQKPDHEAGRGSSAIFDGSGSQLRFALVGGDVRRGTGGRACTRCSGAGTIDEYAHNEAGTCFACMGAGRVAGPEGDEPSNASGSAREMRRVTMAKAASESAGKDLAPFLLDFEDVPDNEAVDLRAGVRVVYRAEKQAKAAGRGDDAIHKALAYVRSKTLAHEPVRGVEELAREIHVHRQKASDAVAELERAKLIVNEPERVGHGAPKPRLWATSTADFSRPTPAAKGRAAS